MRGEPDREVAPGTRVCAVRHPGRPPWPPQGEELSLPRDSPTSPTSTSGHRARCVGIPLPGVGRDRCSRLRSPEVEADVCGRRAGSGRLGQLTSSPAPQTFPQQPDPPKPPGSGSVGQCQRSARPAEGTGEARARPAGLSQQRAVRASACKKTKLPNQRDPLPRPRGPRSSVLEKSRGEQGASGSAHMYLFHKGGDGVGLTTNKMPPNETYEPQTGQLQGLVLGRAWPLGTA